MSSELREKAKHLLQQLNKLLKLDIKNAEVNGCASDDLGSLLSLYQSYLETMHGLLAFLPSPVAQVPYGEAFEYIARHRKLLDDNSQLVSLHMYADSVQRLARFEAILTSSQTLVECQGDWEALAALDRSHFHGMVTEARASPTTDLTLHHVKNLYEHNADGIVVAVRQAEAAALLRSRLGEADDLLGEPLPISSAALDVIRATSFVDRLQEVQTSIEDLARGREDTSDVTFAVLTTLTNVRAALGSWLVCADESRRVAALAEKAAIAKLLIRFQPQIAAAEVALKAAGQNTATGASPALRALASDTSRLTALNAAQLNLAKVHHGIADLVSEARSRFPRFLRWSDDKMLDLAGSTDGCDASLCDAHIASLFHGWKRLQVDPSDPYVVLGVLGVSGELLPLSTPFRVSGPMTTWAPSLRDAVKATLQQQAEETTTRLHRIVMGIEPVDSTVLDDCCAQIGVLALHVMFTSLVESLIPTEGEAASDLTPIVNAGAQHFGPRRPTSVASRPATAATRPGSAVRRLTELMLPRHATTVGERPSSASPSSKLKSSAKQSRYPAKSDEAQHVGTATVRGRDTPGLPESVDVAPFAAIPGTEGSARRQNIRDRHITAGSSKQLQKVMNQLTSVLLRNLARSQDTVERAKIVSWLATLHRMRELWEQHLRKELTSTSDTLWKREARAYFNHTESVEIEVGVLRLSYGWEYTGDIQPFVVTPAHSELWERICVAVETNRGACVVAPNDCGKLASVLALARLTGRCVQLLDAAPDTPSVDVTGFIRSVSATGGWGMVRCGHLLPPEAQAELARCTGAVLGGSARHAPLVRIDRSDFPISEQRACFIVTTAAFESLSEDVRRSFQCCHLQSTESRFILQGALFSRGFRDAAPLATRISATASALAPLMSSKSAGRLCTMSALTGLAHCAGALLPLMPGANEEHVALRALEEYWVPRVEHDDMAAVQRALEPLRRRAVHTTEFQKLAQVVESQLAEQKLRASTLTVHRILALHRWAVAEADNCRPILITGPVRSGKTTLILATSHTARHINDRPNPRVVLLDASQRDAVSAALGDYDATPRAPLWLSVKNPDVDLTSDLHRAAQLPHVTVFIEIDDVGSYPTKQLAHARVVSTAPPTPSDAFGAAVDRVSTTDGHLWTKKVIGDMTALAETHLPVVLASSQVKNTPVYTAVERLVTTASALLAAVPQRNASVMEQIFWLAATWACAGHSRDPWNSMVAASCGVGLEHVTDVWLQSDGSIHRWDALATQSLAGATVVAVTASVARAQYLTTLHLPQHRAIALVGPRATSKSRLASQIAADRGFTSIVVGDAGVLAAVNEAVSLPESAKALVIFDNDDALSTLAIDLIRSFTSIHPHPTHGVQLPPSSRILITCRELPAIIAPFVVPVFVEREEGSHAVAAITKSLKLDGSVSSAFMHCVEGLNRHGYDVSCDAAIRAATMLAHTDRMLVQPEVLTLLRNTLTSAHPIGELRDQIAASCSDMGLREHGNNRTFFYPHASCTKRIVKGDEPSFKAAAIDQGLPQCLWTAGVARILESTAVSLHARIPLVLVGRWHRHVDLILSTALTLAGLPSACDTTASDLDHVVLHRLACQYSFPQWSTAIAQLRAINKTGAGHIFHVSEFASLPSSIRDDLNARCQIVFLEIDQSCFRSMLDRIVPMANDHIAHVLFTDSAACSVAWPDKIDALQKHTELAASRLRHWHAEIGRRHRHLRFTHQVLLDVQRKPPVSSAETHYNPDKSALALRAFQGSVEFDAYPSGAIRLLAKLSETNGKFTDLQHTTVWFEAPFGEFVQPPAIAGGQCRGKVDNNKFVLQSGCYDFHLVPHVDEVSGELQMHGDVLDPASGNSVIGRCYLKEVVDDAALCRQWVRYGDTIPQQEEVLPPELPTPEEANMSPEDLDRAVTSVQPWLKRAIAHQDAVLRDAVLTEIDEANRSAAGVFAAVVARLTASERLEADERLRRSIQDKCGRQLPPITGPETCAHLVGLSDVQFADWCLSQRLRGLPHGPDATFVASTVSAALANRFTPSDVTVVVDPWGVLSTWLASLDAVNREASAFLHSADSGASAVNSASLIVTSVSGSNCTAVVKACAKLPRRPTCLVLVTADAAAASSWGLEWPVINSIVTTDSLHRQLQAQSTSIASDATVQRTAINALGKGVIAEATASQAHAALASFVGDQVQRAERNGHRKDSYVAFADPGFVATIADLDRCRTDIADCRSFVLPTPAVKKELDDVSLVARRLACLCTQLDEVLGVVNINYSAPHSLTLKRANDVMRGAPRSTEAASRAFLEPVMASLLEADRLVVGAGVGLRLAVDRNQVSHDTVRGLLGGFLAPAVDEQAAFEAAESERYNQAKAEADQRERLQDEGIGANVKGSKNKTKPGLVAYSQVALPSKSPLVRPENDSVSDATWARILAVARAFPVFSALPAAFHETTESHVKAAATLPRQARWNEWFDTVGSSSATVTLPLPGLEKDAVPSVARACLLLAARPERIRAGLRLLASDVGGGEWAVGLEVPPDQVTTLAALDANTPRTLPIVVACPHRLPRYQLQGLVGKACSRRRIDADNDAKSKKSKSGATSIDSIPVLVYRNGTQPVQVLVAAVHALSDASQWLLIDRVHEASPRVVGALLSAIASVSMKPESRVVLALDLTVPSASSSILRQTVIPRVGVAMTSGLKESLQHAYSAVVDERVLSAFKDAEWRQVIFCVAFIIAALEQRGRYENVGRGSDLQIRDVDSELSSVLSFLVTLLRTRSSRESVPWDELREAVSNVVGASASDVANSAVARALVDWILHPDVTSTSSDAELRIGTLRVPASADYESCREAIEELASGAEFPELYGLHAAAEECLEKMETQRLRRQLESFCPATTDSLSFRHFEAKLVASLVTMEEFTATSALCKAMSSSEMRYVPCAREIAALVELHRRVANDLSQPATDVVMSIASNLAPRSWQGAIAADSLPGWVNKVNVARDQLVVWHESGTIPFAVNSALLHSPTAVVAATVVDAMAESSVPMCPRGRLLNVDDAYEKYRRGGPGSGVVLGGVALEGAAVCAQGHLVDVSDERAASASFVVYVHAQPVADGFEAPADEDEDEVTLLADVITRKNVFLSRNRPMSASRRISAPVRPLISTLPRSKEGIRLVSVPLFRTANRDWILNVDVNSEREQNHWILRGASLYGTY
jgi:hypothetical protein